MKYLVLGSAGQIGAELCKHLKSEGHSVTEFDIASNPSQDLRVQNILNIVAITIIRIEKIK